MSCAHCKPADYATFFSSISKHDTYSGVLYRITFNGSQGPVNIVLDLVSLKILKSALDPKLNTIFRDEHERDFLLS